MADGWKRQNEWLKFRRRTRCENECEAEYETVSVSETGNETGCKNESKIIDI